MQLKQSGCQCSLILWPQEADALRPAERMEPLVRKCPDLPHRSRTKCKFLSYCQTELTCRDDVGWWLSHMLIPAHIQAHEVKGSNPNPEEHFPTR